MGMAACGHCVLIGGYQRKNGVVVPVRGVVALGDVVIQEDHFVLADEGEILPEPLQLDVREPGMVFRAFFLLLERVYVVHAHEMHVADIERIPTRPQCLGEGFAGVIHGILVVVACRCVIGHPERSHYPLVFQVALPITPAHDIAQRDGYRVGAGLAERAFHVGDRLPFIADDLLVAVGLRVADQQQGEVLLGLRYGA